MAQTHGQIRQQAVVLVINDKPSLRVSTTSRLYAAGIGTVVTPADVSELLDSLFPNSPQRPPSFTLIILDYLLEDWVGITFSELLKRVQESERARVAPIVILTAYPQGARNDKSLRKYEVIDAVAAGDTGIDEIVEKYIG